MFEDVRRPGALAQALHETAGRPLFRCRTGCTRWALRDGLQLRRGDHAGVGHLELVDAQRRLFHCRFTLDHNLAALRLLAQFERLQECEAGARTAPEHDEPLCPICKAGFLLTLASTGATLVPPYLTMPLMDKVLIPFQNGQPINRNLVLMLLGGILGSALLAWFLGWARTYILALISERIGCDLRTVTYEHLLTLPLEYFGGKRTGDLLTRIGSESDRICLYLSLHLLDFATDVLMLAMIAAILVSINPMLALVTLLPLPLIAWMIQLVRDRLRTGFEKIDRAWSELSSVLADTIPGIRVVKAFAQEGREACRFREANRHYLTINDRLN